jgi:hypothetical protein
VSVRVEAAALPCLPALPWHITDPARFAAECRLLHAAGLSVAIDAHPHKRPGLALRLAADGSRPLTVFTGPDYPYERPVLLDEHGRRVSPRQRWSADRFLVDLVGKAR